MPMFSDSIRGLAASLVVAALIIAALVLGREIVLPLALAALIAFPLSPIVRRLTELHVPRGVASGLVVAMTVCAVAALSIVFTTQLINLAGSLDSYRHNLVQKVRTITGASVETSAFQRAANAVDALEKELTKEMRRSVGNAGDRDPVVLKSEQQSTEGPWQQLAAALHPLAIGALTLLFTVFLLAQYQDLRDRVVRVAGTDNMSRTVAALNDAGTRLSNLFLAQLALNAGFGAFVGIALALTGVPNAVLWGISVIALRFIPYVGSILAAIPPIVLAAAVDPGWSMVAITVAIFAIGEPVVGHLIEPLVLGKRAGLSPIALIVAASFWTLIWGPIGLLLAAPLTMTIVVLGQYIPRFEFMSVLLGNEPALDADEELYHRLLSGDAIAAFDQVMALAAGTSVTRATDDIVLPALALMARDGRTGRLSDEQATAMQRTLKELNQLLAEELAEEGCKTHDASTRARGPVVLIPARGTADAVAAGLAKTFLECAGTDNVIAMEKVTGLLGVASVQVATKGEIPHMVVIIATNPSDDPLIQHMERRIRREQGNIATYVLLAAEHASPVAQGASPGLNGTARLRSIRELRATIAANRSAPALVEDPSAPTAFAVA